jgi:putative ABC transport system substrate-binding protein
MKRRTLVQLAGAVAMFNPAWGRAQQSGKVFRLGFLWENPSTFPEALVAFREELRRLGYVEGRNLVIEFRWAEGKPDRMRELAEELVRLRVDVIVAPSSVYTGAARDATSTIPIIFLSHAEPVLTGHVKSLARPGGNVTGFSLMMTETNVKALEILKEALSNLSRVAVLFDPATPSHAPGLRAVDAAGPSMGLRIQRVPAEAASKYDGAFAAMSAEGAQAVLVLSTPLFIAGAKRLADLGLKYRLPSLYGPRDHVVAGGLMSYSPNRSDLWRRGAGYVDEVLKGVKPADLAVQQPTKFELIVNLKTAKAIGITMRPEILARADEVIE